MYKISLTLVKIVLFGAIITATELVAMEKDEDSRGGASTKGYVRQIHPVFTPVFSEKFDCFLNSKIITSQDLTSQHSILIRTTIHKVFSIMKLNPLDIAYQQFGELKELIGRCVAIGQKWSHPSLLFFESIQQLYFKPSLIKPVNLKEKLNKIVTAFFKTQANLTSVDSLELKLIFMSYGTEPYAATGVDLCKKLVDMRRPELAVYYLLAYARKVPNLKSGRWLCEQARDIEAAQAVKFKAENVSILESRHAEEQLKAFMLAEWMLLRKEPSDNIIALEAALRCMPHGSQVTKFIFQLTDRLVLQGRQDIAIYYLLSFAAECSDDSYATAMECYKKAAQYGSSEAKKKELQFQLENPSSACDDLIKFKPEYLDSLKSGQVYTLQEPDELSSAFGERHGSLPVINVYGALLSSSEEEKEVDA